MSGIDCLIQTDDHPAIVQDAAPSWKVQPVLAQPVPVPPALARSHAPAAVPRLEASFRSLRRCRKGRNEGFHILALEVDARLALRAGLENRVERARAALARRLLESKSHEAAGYTRFCDYAREELGCSLRSLQDLARLDRALDALPQFDRQVSSGRLSLSRVLAVLPVATAENEGFWLTQAQKQTHRELVRRVRIARETQATSGPAGAAPTVAAMTAAGSVGGGGCAGDVTDSGGGSSGGAGSGGTGAGGVGDGSGSQVSATLLQRMPTRSRLLWEAFVEESSRQSGRNVSQGEALEILLAEFWPLVPQEARAILDRRIQPPRSAHPTAAQPGVLLPASASRLPEDAACDEDLDPLAGPGSIADTPGPHALDLRRLRDPDGFQVAPHQTDGRSFVMRFLSPRSEWYRKLAARFEEMNAPWTELRRHALDHQRERQAAEKPSALPPRADELLDLSGLDSLAPEELERRFIALRAYRRRLSADVGALLFLARTLRLHRGLGFASFGHYTRERLGLSRRTADHQAGLHQLLAREPVLLRAYGRDRISDSSVPFFRRLLTAGIRGKNLRPWVRRASQVPLPVFRDMVRWIEARREAWWRSIAETPYSPCPVLPPTYREWVSTRRLLNASPEALAYVALGCAETEQMSARPQNTAPVQKKEGGAEADAGTEQTHDGGDSGPDGRQLDPLFPSIEEPATRTCVIRAVPEVIVSYLDAVEAVRVIYGDNKPAWWCLEVMMLFVRRDWMRESRACRRKVEHYDIFERDGFRCACPGCSSRSNLQGHHIRFRSQGGSDERSNLITLCEACHSFGVHRSGMIRVRGRAPGRLIWELGFMRGEDGSTGSRRRYVGEFRHDQSALP